MVSKSIPIVAPVKVDIVPITELPPTPTVAIKEATVGEKLMFLNKKLAWAAGEDLLRAQGLNTAEYVVEATEKNGEWFVAFRSRTQFDANGKVIL